MNLLDLSRSQFRIQTCKLRKAQTKLSFLLSLIFLVHLHNLFTDIMTKTNIKNKIVKIVRDYHGKQKREPV